MKVSIEREKLDLLANVISDKSGEAIPMTLAEMTDAVDNIQTGGSTPAPVLQTKTYTVDSAGTATVTADSGYDGLSSVEVSVPSADPWIGVATMGFYTDSNNRRWRFRPMVEFSEGEQVGWMDTDTFGDYWSTTAVPAGTAITPTESTQTVGGTVCMMEGAVTVNAIPSNYVGSGITRRTSSDLTASGATVTAPAGYYESAATKTVASGTAGTPTATKSAVNNHAVTVTPAVTNTTGYITGSTKTGTAVSVSASELVSGSQTITENGTVDVTNLAEVVVNVSGGGGGTIQTATKTTTLASASSSIQFTGLLGNPTSFAVTSQADIATYTNDVSAVVFDGTDLNGQTVTTQATADTAFTKSYSSGTLTITSTNAEFQANAYELVYTYGGSASDIETANVQVGSGATTITFPVSGRPAYWSCIFKSDFTTSSGYQRVIAVVNDGSSTSGLAMDSSAHAASYWSASYSGGNLTISSQSTNMGGYFHQPGYYQLTYYVDSSAPSYQTKTVTPTTSQQTVTPDAGYDALEQVTVNAIPSQYVVPTGNLAITSNSNSINVANYATVSVNVPTGGSSTNAQAVTSTSRVTSTTLSACSGTITVAKTGTYDVYWSTMRSSTSGTWQSQLYINNVAYGSTQGTFSNHVQAIHLSNVSLSAGDTVQVYARSRGTNYYAYVPLLTIIES